MQMDTKLKSHQHDQVVTSYTCPNYQDNWPARQGAEQCTITASAAETMESGCPN